MCFVFSLSYFLIFMVFFSESSTATLDLTSDIQYFTSTGKYCLVAGFLVGICTMFSNETLKLNCYSCCTIFLDFSLMRSCIVKGKHDQFTVIIVKTNFNIIQ